MPSGADLEYAKMLAIAGIDPANTQGLDGARLQQLADESASVSLRSQSVRPRTIALLGDSIVNQNSSVTSTSANFNASGFFTWANSLLGQRFTIVGPASDPQGEFGGSGLTVDNLITGGHVSAVAASSAAYVVIHAGTNSLATRSGSQIADELLSICRTFTAVGKLGIITTILPRDNPDSVGTLDKVREANRLIRAFSRTEPNVILCDWYSTLVDPATGKADLNYFYDGVHPDGPGASRMGKILADVLDGITPADGSVLPFDTFDVKGLLPNPFMTGNTAGVSTLTNFYVQGAGVWTPTKVARTDGIPGEWQQVAITSAANPSADGVELQQQNTAVGVDWNVGDRVYGVAEFETDAASWNVRQFNLILSAWNGVGGAHSSFASSTDMNNYTASLLRPPKGVLKTGTLVVPAGTARLQLNVNVRGLSTYRIGRFEIFKE